MRAWPPTACCARSSRWPTTSTGRSRPGLRRLADDPWAEGVAAIDRKLRLLLESEGVTPIEVTPGAAFDPHEHEAIVSVPGSGQPEGSVVAELQRGYRIRDRVLRPGDGRGRGGRRRRRRTAGDGADGAGPIN